MSHLLPPALLLAACLLLTACSGNRELVRRAHDGDAAAQFEYGRRLLTGQHRWFSSPRHAPGWFRLAAEQDYAPAQAALGACYEAGLGIAPSAEQAEYWYSRAAGQGSPIADMQLAVLAYEKEKNPQRALELIQKAANAGIIPARLRLARMLLEGSGGVEQDAQRAIDLLRLAAMEGSGEAAYLIGLCYAEGRGVPQHSGIALGWFETAAEEGYAPAQAVLHDLEQAD